MEIENIKKRKSENDPTYDNYRRIGFKKYQRSKRNPEIEIYEKELNQYRETGKQMYKNFCSGKITHEEFENWVNEQDK